MKTAQDLIERAYWALTMNALEPIDDGECYNQDDLSELIEHLGEFINNS